ncbi:tetratricopeptide repeat protein [Maricaulis maris]|uniref:tetratricopeptide repeat protein n=1 Tax=Maricaulis maris TaxID=74318 RepID=UPI003B8C50F9
MRHHLLSGIAAMAVLAPLAHAQTETSDAYVEAAIATYRDGDTDEALRQAEAAVAAAQSPAEAFNASILYGDLRLAVTDLQGAYELFSRAVEIVETNDAENLEALDIALTRQANAALQLGRRAEWQAIGDRLLELNRAQDEWQWRFEDENAVTHRFTSYYCPSDSGPFVRREMISFDARGTDVACSYAVRNQQNPTITIHMYHTPESSQEQSFEAAMTSMRRNFNTARDVEAGTTELGGVPVRYTLLEQNGTQSGTWTSWINGWTLKLRMTHYGELTRADFDAAAELTFSGASAMQAHLETCRAIEGSDTAEFQQASSDMGASLENALMMSLLAAPETDPVSRDSLSCYLGAAEFRPRGGVLSAILGPDGTPIAYRASPTGDPMIRIEAGESSNLLAISRGEDEDRAVVSLTLSTADGRGSYGSFTEWPSPQRFAETIDQLLRENWSVTNWVRYADGGAQITLGGDGPAGDSNSEPD